MKSRNEKLGFVMILVSGFVMYMLLAIFFWIEATAAPLGGKQDLDAESLGFWHELYNDENYNGMTVVAISQMMKAAVFTRAYEECRDRAGDIDGECYNDRQQAIFAAMVKHLREQGWDATNQDAVAAFWQYAIDSEWDEATTVSLCMSMYVSKMMDHLEPRS